MFIKKNSLSGLLKGTICIPLLFAMVFFASCSEQDSEDHNKVEQTDQKINEDNLETSEQEFPYKEVNGSKIYLKAGKMPSFKGQGVLAFRKYIQNHLEYPEEAAKAGLEGKVFIKFVINEEGENTDVEVMRGEHEKLNRTVVKAIQNAPEWDPARHNGQKVKIQFTIPVIFKQD